MDPERLAKRKLLKYKAMLSAGSPLDSLLDSGLETRLRKRNEELLLDAAEVSNLSYHDLECLMVVYHKFRRLSRKSHLGIEKVQFRDILHSSLDMTEDHLMDRIFYTLDKGPGSYMTFEVWASTLSLFLAGTLDDKISYCFQVYDVGGHEMIARDIMFHLLRSSFADVSTIEEAEESAKEMAEVLSMKMDKDRDGKISLADFTTTVKKQPLLLEAFGQCLPDRQNVSAFLTVFAEGPVRV